MHARALMPAVAALILAASSAAAPAQENPGAQPVRLALPESMKEPVRFVFALHTTQAAPMGDSDVTSTIELSLQVLEATEDGGRRCRVRFGRWTTKGEVMVLGKLDVDSTRPISGQGMERIMAVGNVALADVTVEVVLDAAGRVTRVVDLDGVVKAKIEKHGFKGLDEMALRMAAREESVKRCIDCALHVTPLPSDALSAGSKWKDADILPRTSQQQDLTMETEWTVKSIDAEAVRLTGEGKATVQVKGAPGRGAAPAIEGGASSVEAKAAVSRADGLPLETEFALAVEMEVSGLSVEQTVKGTVKRVERWPSEEPLKAGSGREVESGAGNPEQR